jgi:regulator of protease activity HflC (stomatin/prohibitin superfamily)
MSTEVYEGSKVGNDSVAARSSDGQLVYIDSSVIYKIDANEAVRVHIDLQERYVEDFIRPVMRGIIRTEVSQFTADEINSSKRKNLEENLGELLREAFSEKGFVLDRFLLRNIAFSPQYSGAIEQKQVAEQDRLQAEYQAERVRKLAEGERDRLKIEADGKAAAIEIEAQAQATAVVLKAQADANALELVKQALNQDQTLLTYRYIEKISPGIRVMLLPNNNPLLLPLPDLLGGDQAGVQATNTLTATLASPSPTPTSTAVSPIPEATLTPTPSLTP